jgi:hypothetical protein
MLRFIPRPHRVVLSKVDVEVPELGKGVALVVVLGPEAKSLVVVHRSRDVGNPKDRFVADNGDRTAGSFQLEGALAVHPVNALVADPDVGWRPQSDKAAGERLLTVGTHEGL